MELWSVVAIVAVVIVLALIVMIKQMPRDDERR
jgi:hypothetical protein